MKQLTRRRFLQAGLSLATVGFVVGCERIPVPGRTVPRVPRVGLLVPGSPPTRPTLEGFRRGIREVGYVEGETVVLDIRWDEGKPDAWPGLVADLLRQEVDVIVAGTTPSIRPAQEATKTIPIVAPTMADPVRDGLVVSLARPGGNLTGLTLFQPLLNAKRLELLTEALPDANQVAVAWWAGYADPELPQVEEAARANGVQLLPREVRGPEDLDGAFRGAVRDGAQALLLAQGAPFTTHLARIVELTLGSRLPAMAGEAGFAQAGGLMNYGPDVVENWRRAATYVDKILKGSKPGELPVERPAKLDFVVNLKTARELGLSMPQSVLQQATEIVQ